METPTTLKGVKKLTNQLVIESLTENIHAFFDWAFIEAGGYSNVSVPTPGTADPYGNGTLHTVQSEGVTNGTIWEGMYQNWAYETATGLTPPPTIASGVYVNGILYPTSTTTGTYAHYINYPAGQIVFSHAIPTTSIVQANYSYKVFNIYDHEVPWFRDVVFDSFLLNQPNTMPNFQEVLKENQIRLPAIIIEPVLGRRQRGMMLGSGAQWVEQDILFHILTERADERNNIVDIITLQKDREIYLFDTNARRIANDFPLDWRGNLTSSGSMYPDLITKYPWTKAFISRMTTSDVSLRLPLYRGIVRLTLEVDVGEI